MSTQLRMSVHAFGVNMDDAQRKHSLKIGTRNETFVRDMLEFARQRPDLMPAGINISALLRNLTTRDQISPLVFQLEAILRTLKDSHIALGVDLYDGTRGLYKAIKPIADINGVQDTIERIGQRFAGQGRRKVEPAPDSVDSSGS